MRGEQRHICYERRGRGIFAMRGEERHICYERRAEAYLL